MQANKQRSEPKVKPSGQLVGRSLEPVVRPKFSDHIIPAASLLVAMMQVSTSPMGNGVEWWINLGLKFLTALLFCLIAVANIMRTSIYYADRSNAENQA